MLFKFTPYWVLYGRRTNTPVLTVIQKNILLYASDSHCEFKNENYTATESMPYKQLYTRHVKVNVHAIWVCGSHATHKIKNNCLII